MSFEGHWDQDKDWDEWTTGIVMWSLILVLEGVSVLVICEYGTGHEEDGVSG